MASWPGCRSSFLPARQSIPERGDTQISGAVVSWFGPATGSTTADAFGNYATSGLPAGTYTFVATASGCDPDIATVEIIAGKTVRRNFEINCAP